MKIKLVIVLILSLIMTLFTHWKFNLQNLEFKPAIAQSLFDKGVLGSINVIYRSSSIKIDRNIKGKNVSISAKIGNKILCGDLLKPSRGVIVKVSCGERGKTKTLIGTGNITYSANDICKPEGQAQNANPCSSQGGSISIPGK